MIEIFKNNIILTILLFILTIIISFIVSKKGSNKLKITIMNISAYTILLLILVFCLIKLSKHNFDINDDISYILLIILCGIPLWLCAWTTNTSRKKEYTIQQKTYSEIRLYIKERLKTFKYRQELDEDDLLIFKYKKYSQRWLYIISKINDLDENKYKTVDKKIQKFIKEDLDFIKDCSHRRALVITNIIITDKYNECLEKIIQQRVEGIRYYVINVGICTNDKKMHMYENQPGYDYLYFTKLHKNLLRLFEIKK